MSTTDGPQHLPRGLTSTVSAVGAILGRVVAVAEGETLYDSVEAVRRQMVAFREADDDEAREAALDAAARRLRALSPSERLAVARAFTLYLELVNACENAYRTHRLRHKLRSGRSASSGARLTFVLTAHPTESRSPDNIRLLRRVQDHLTACLERRRSIDEQAIENVLQVAWRVGTHPARKPAVEDEANHLFSLLTDPILAEMTALADAGHRLRVHSWVGGDKDGHPGVGPEQTAAALQLGRQRLLEFVRGRLLEPARSDVVLAGGDQALSAFAELEQALEELEQVAEGDGGRVDALVRAMTGFQEAYRQQLGIEHPQIAELATLLEIFPALVVPLELREERGHFEAGRPVAAMMRRLRQIAAGGPLDGYVRSVVVSMTCRAADLLEAQQLVADVFGELVLPVVPLFELPEVLERAEAILREAWADGRYRQALRRGGHVEVMLGYSDTAKRMGMLASRVALHDAMGAVAAWADSVGLTPVFFHGHGGSVGRGGGRIEDLAATWPAAARVPYKYTVQGEMVERTFATPEILRSLVEKVAAVQADPPGFQPVGELARQLATASQQAFAAEVGSEPFRELLAAATPYTRLAELTIGSRPVARTGGGFEQLRAIPWVLCFTQTRLLLHGWLGVGQAWRARRRQSDAEQALARAGQDDPLFRSYARLLSFTIAKTAPTIWRRYRQVLAPNAAAELVRRLDDGYAAARELACRALGAGTLLPARPWLEESIRYRAPMIHPLNLLQIELLRKSEWNEAEAELFRETVTGIAAGMLTTG